MNKRSISALCLLLFSVSLSGVAFAQKMPAKKLAAVSDTGTRSSSVMGEIRVYTDGVNGAVVEWTTTYELGNLGFNVYRVDMGGSRQQVNDSLIGGSLVRFGEKTELAGGYTYSAYDAAGRPDAVYYVETIDKAGRKAVYGPVSPVYAKNITKRPGYNPQLRADFTGESNAVIEKNSPTFSKTRSDSPAFPSTESSPVDPVNQHWVAAQPGVKIKVNKDGIYHISRAQLQAAGFDVASPQANWQLYLYGVEQKIIVEPAGNYIEFYGRGLDIQNSDSQIYYLITGPGAGQRMGSIVRRPFSPGIIGANFRNLTHYEPRTNYVSTQIVNGDLDNWFGPVITSSVAVTRNVSLKDIDVDGGDVPVQIALHGLQNGPHSVQVTLNGNIIGKVDFDGVVPVSKTFSVKPSRIVEGNNTFDFIGTSGPIDNTLLDYVEINYQRLYKADQNTLAFDTQNLHATKVTGFDTANVRVFDLYYHDDPMLIVNTTTAPGASGFDVSIPSGRAHQMIAVNENSMLSPVAITLNTPSQLSNTSSTADMLIISHGSFMTEANNWANYRRGQSLTVDVVNADDVYDEFDYGLPTPEAIKGYLQYFKNNDANLKYVLLIGDATYDPRNYLGAGFNDLIPTKFVNTSFGESPSDEALGDFNNDGTAEMALGRLPVRVGQNASVTLMQSKVAAFEGAITNAMVTRGALFVADDPLGYNFAQVNQNLRGELPPEMPVVFINRGDDPDITVIRARIITDINNGRFLVNYSGHGSTGVWSSSQMLRIIDIPLMTNSGNKLSLFLMLTCLNGFFVDPSVDWMAEALVKAPNGGAVVSWASTGSTTPDIQEIMATRFFHILGQGTHNRLGDAIKESKENAPSMDVPLTWVLIGDPALKIK
jgi:hypothetical protein